MKQLHRKRSLSQNNATSEAKRILRHHGFTTAKGNKGRVTVNGKEYVLTYTSYKSDGPDARQYDTSTEGLVSLWLADGNFYIFDRFELGYKKATRELGTHEFVQVDRRDALFDTAHLLDTVPVQDKVKYRKDVEDGVAEACVEQQEILKYLK